MQRQNSVGFAIRSLSNLLRRKMMELTPPPSDRHGITETEGLIMGFLCDHPERELYQRDVEEVFCIRRSTASRFLQNLERDGMLVRRSVPRDARLKKLIPTEKALAVHACIAEKFQIAEKLMTAGLTEGEVEQFIATARKIQHNLLE